jgi:dynein heavy chain
MNFPSYLFEANKWIKNMERANDLKVITLNQYDFMRTLENAMRFGAPVLLQDVGEELDPALDPILNKSIVKVGNRTLIRLEEGKEVEYNTDFRLYITSKAKNPKFKPEVSTKTTIVNFTVTEQVRKGDVIRINVCRDWKLNCLLL